jgi:hypothetical protein
MAALLGLLALAASARADDDVARVKVADPYLELHTAPGRGYPVFYVVERGQWVEILKRRTDWFLVRTVSGKQGWASRAQLERTLTEAGVGTTFRDVLVEDFLSRRLEVGAAWGEFDSDPVVALRVGYRFASFFIAELAASEATRTYGTTSVVQASLQVVPFDDRSLAPFFALGVGPYKIKPKPSLVGTQPEVSGTASHAGIGVRWYLTRNFLLRADFKEYLAPLDENTSDRYREWTLGAAVFF